MPKQIKLVNRGGAGLLSKVAKPDGYKPKEQEHLTSFNKIDKSLSDLAVKIADLVMDPNNARLHPERNLEAIKFSLCKYGQVKPIVVRRETNVIMAGNGTTEAAKALGWTKIAAVFIDMTDAEAAGYGLADNRTAELASWDFEVVARLEKFISEASGGDIVGWSDDEIMALRKTDWESERKKREESNGEGVLQHICPNCKHSFDCDAK